MNGKTLKLERMGVGSTRCLPNWSLKVENNKAYCPEAGVRNAFAPACARLIVTGDMEERAATVVALVRA